MAVEVIEIEVDITTKGGDKLKQTQSMVKTTIGEFENLNEAISKTQDELGKLDPKSEKFKAAAKDLSDLKDRLRETEAQSLRFTEALAQQPGVMGLVGQSLEGLRGTFKLFMANPIIAVVTGIVGAFMAMKESLSKTSEGQEVLNKISAAFGKIIGPVMAIIEKVALPIFEKLADLLAFVAEGFGKVATALGVSESKIEEASRNSSEVLQEAFEEEQKRQEEETKLLEEENQKRADARQKAVEEAKRKREEEAKQRLADLQTAEKIQLEAELSLLSDRDRELKEREMRFQEELAALKKAGFTDLTAFEAEYRLDLLAINKGYDDELLQAQKEADEKLKAEREKAAEEEKKRAEELAQFNIDAKQFEADAIMAIQDMQISNIQGVAGILSQVAGRNKKLAIAGVVLEQGAAVAKVVIDTARAISSASAAAAPFMANPITAIPATANLARVIAQQKIAAGISIAGIVAGAAKGISQISQTQIPGGGGGGGGGSAGGGGGGGSIPSFSAPSAMAAPQIQTGVGESPQSQIAQTIGMAQNKPIVAQVVSTAVSSQQALDRRTNSASTFGG
jgi:actin-related protein